MITTNARKLRMNLKSYLDDATECPIRILRGSNQTFVLMNEEEMNYLNDTIKFLQSQLLDAMHKLNKAKDKPLQ